MSRGAIIAAALLGLLALAVVVLLALSRARAPRRQHQRSPTPHPQAPEPAVALVADADAGGMVPGVGLVGIENPGSRAADAESGTIAHVSPDRRTWTLLKDARYLAPGEALYMLELVGVAFTGRWFADAAVWSADSRFLALPELMPRTHPGEGRYRVLVVDTERQRHATIEPMGDTGLTPIRIDAHILLVQSLPSGAGAHFDLDAITNWQPLRA